MCGMVQEDFKKISDWGFNVIRLGIIWDGLEPEPGVYNDSMFQCLDERIGWAGENGLYVILDMHQDLYSVQFSDGAPDWATLTDDQPHYTGAVWSDAYLISPAVQTAFDNFWNNTPASDGVGIQDHYANLWKYIAERYADEPAVIGYDLMNEPFIGIEASNFFPAMVGYLFDHAHRTSKCLNMPMLVGECGQTFWAHYEGIENYPYFSALIRPRPIEVAGTIESFKYDPQQNRFSCSWNEDGKGQQPSTFFLPGVSNADALDIKLTPNEDGFEIKVRDNARGAILSIEPSENNLLRELTITF